jgi:dihydrofolate reductase
MSNRVVCDISVSADGYVAGPGQTADKPFGDGPVDRLHAWMFDTPDEHQAEVDRVVAAGAFVMGRNMFGPIRGQRWLRPGARSACPGQDAWAESCVRAEHDPAHFAT